MSEAKWYVVHTYSGYENKVNVDIEKTIEIRHLEDQILEVRVPLQEVAELKNGALKQVQKKMFPGYVLVKMIQNDDTWYVVRNTRGVTGFVGPGSEPIPLTAAEIKAMGIDLPEDKPRERIEFKGQVGDSVIILSGPFAEMQGKIKNNNDSRQEHTIVVEMFRRETPAEVNFGHVRNIKTYGSFAFERGRQEVEIPQ